MTKFNFYTLKSMLCTLLWSIAFIAMGETRAPQFPVPISGQSKHVIAAIEHLKSFDLNPNDPILAEAFGIMDTSLIGLQAWVKKRVDLILVESEFTLQVQTTDLQLTTMIFDYNNTFTCGNRSTEFHGIHLSVLLNSPTFQNAFSCMQIPISKITNPYSPKLVLNKWLIQNGKKFEATENVISLNSKFLAQPKVETFETETHSAFVFSIIMHEARHSDEGHFYHAEVDPNSASLVRDIESNGAYTLEAAILLHLAKGIKNTNPKAAIEILANSIDKLYAAPESELSNRIYEEILNLRTEIKKSLTPAQLEVINPFHLEFELI